MMIFLHHQLCLRKRMEKIHDTGMSEYKKIFWTEDVIVSSGSFHIEDREKAALVGPNGAGKSTILKMIVGELPSDGGDILLAKGKTLGYLAQHQEMQYRQPPSTKRFVAAKEPIFAMERKIRRDSKHDMKHLTGEELSGTLEQYQPTGRLSLNLKMDTPVKVRSSGF